MKNIFKALSVVTAAFMMASCGNNKSADSSQSKEKVMYDAVVYSPKGDTLYHAVVGKVDYQCNYHGTTIEDPVTHENFETSPGTTVTFRPFMQK